MWNHRSVRLPGPAAIAALFFEPSARGELATWEQARVTEIAKQLTTATDALYDTFVKQLRPTVASMQTNAYHRLKQWVRLLRIEARELASSLEKGEGREETLPIYENLMQLTRSARDDAAKVFVAHDVASGRRRCAAS